jgi:hypothetical protein
LTIVGLPDTPSAVDWKVIKAALSPGEAEPPEVLEDAEPDWSRECEVCGRKPVVAATGLCGPCTFGEADTAGGNW